MSLVILSVTIEYLFSVTGERGLTVMCTKPKILFCDLKLQPGDSRSCELTPSFPHLPLTFVEELCWFWKFTWIISVPFSFNCHNRVVRFQRSSSFMPLCIVDFFLFLALFLTW